MKQLLLSVAVVSSGLILFACGGSGGGSGSGSGSSATTIDLTGVKQLMLAPGGLSEAVSLTASALTASANSVYAVDQSGKITTAKIADLVSGVSNSSASSSLMFNSPQYVFFQYDGLNQPINGGANSKQCVLVGVRKSDGKLACISSSPRCDSNNVCNVEVYKSQVKMNPSGDMLFLVLGDGGLNKVDLSDPTNPVETSVFTHSSLGDASVPIVNASNDVMVAVNTQSGGISTKIFGANGQTYTIPGSDLVNHITCSFSGNGDTGSNFYYVYLNQASTQFSYIKMARNQDGSFTSSTTYTENVGAGVLGANCTNVVSHGTRIFGLNYYNPGNPSFPGNSVLMEYPTSTGSILHYTLDTAFPVKTSLQAYSGGLVILGTTADGTKSGIEVFNPTTTAVTTVLPASQFSIKSMTVASNGDISFVGVRLSDNVNVLGKIPASVSNVSQSSLAVPPISIVALN